MGQADRLELWFPPGHPAPWREGGGHTPFISSPSRLKWAPSCPRGAHTWSPAFKALPTAPTSPPQLPFPRGPPPTTIPTSLWLRPKLGPLIQALRLGWGRGEGGRQQEGRRACLTWTSCPGRSQPQGWAPDLSPWQPVGGGALLPHLLMRHSQWQAATLDSPLRWRRQPPGYFQSHLVSQRRRQEGALVL